MSFTEHQAAIAARLVGLLAGGMTVYEAADEVGYSWTYCYAILRAAGRGVMPRPSADRPAQVAAAFAELGSMSAVARSMKMGRQTVRRLLVEQGITPPAPSCPYPAEVKARFLALTEQGWTTRGAAGEVGIKRDLGYYWRREAAQRARRVEAGETGPAGYNDAVNIPTSLGPGRFLSLQDRLAIADGLAANKSMRSIAAALGKDRSTVYREIARNSSGGDYLPYGADQAATVRRARPKDAKLVVNQALRAQVEDGLARRLSPEQIAQRLRLDFPDDQDMRVSHETIYQALYFQARGGLKKQVQTALRTGRTRRKPHRKEGQRTQRFIDPMIMISDRPAEIEDRAVPGHWEGDLIIGAHNKSAIGTLVERSTRYTMLLHLPHGHDAEHVRDALIATMTTLPAHLRGSLTWDQGAEMASHKLFTIATDMAVYFCDPASPWQRGTNENTNGLLRQYFPKGTDLNVYGPEDLEHVAQELNGRPRKTLNWHTPAEQLRDLLTTDK